MNMMIWPRFLQEGSLKLVFFGGKGGVGKSTCATSAALKLAQTKNLFDLNKSLAEKRAVTDAMFGPVATTPFNYSYPSYAIGR